MSQWSLEGDSTLAGGESRLVLPCTEGAASAFDLGRGRLFAAYGKVFAHSTVSRVQCSLSVEAGSLRVESRGQNPTGIRPAGGAWRLLAQQQHSLLNDGDELALDKMRKPGTVFTVRKRPREAAVAAPPTPAAAAPFAGLRVMFGLRSARQAEIQAGAIVRHGGVVVAADGDAAAATHLVLDHARDAATHPALAALPASSWPRLHTEEWAPHRSSAVHSGGAAPPDEHDVHPAPPPPAPPTRFAVGTAWLNLLHGEAPSGRHVTYSELKPDGCVAALFTSLFPDRAYDWLRSNSAEIGDVLIIADRCPKLDGNPPPTLRERDPGWLLLEGQRTSGIVHCSLLLFRTPTSLRVALGGTNLDGQIHLVAQPREEKSCGCLPRGI